MGLSGQETGGGLREGWEESKVLPCHARGGSGHVAGCSNSQEVEGSWLAWRRVKGGGRQRSCWSGLLRAAVTLSRGDKELEFGDIQDSRQRGEAEGVISMWDSLLKWLGLDKPPQQRVRHKVWGKQLVDNTRQLRLGADRARQMLDGTEVVRAVRQCQWPRVWLGLGQMQIQGLRQVVVMIRWWSGG